jgi:type IV pilus assembly protein PilC
MAEKKAFNYIAQDDSGNLVEGTIKATDSEQVNNFFLSRGYIPLEINETSIFNREIKFGKKRVKDKEVAIFARQFATMSNAAVPIIKILEVIGSQTSNETFKEILALMTTDINDGVSLSEAMAKHPTVFSPIFINMVSAAEAGGFLTKALFSIADNMDAQVRLRAKIKSAMTYPIVIFILAILLTIGMLIFIVPIFTELFEGLGGELPFLTQVLVFLSDIMKWAIFPLAGLAVYGFFWWKKNKNNYKVRKIVDPIKTKIPIFGEINKMIIMARFARNFASLHDAAVPISQIFDIVGATTGSVLLEESLVPVKENVLKGGTIVEPMKKDPIFPKMLVEMTAIGEETGDIAIMLNKAAESYEFDVEARTDQLSSLIEPIMLVLLGLIVGGMIVALYLPIFSIGELLAV